MLKNSQEIVELGLLKLENSHGKPAQIGYDLSLKSVSLIGINNQVAAKDPKIGMVLKDKTLLTNYTELSPIRVDGHEGWMLYPGAYEFTFHEGLEVLPPNLSAKITQRSSLARNGAYLESSWFDPGFGTDNIGTTLMVNNTLFIEKDARVAQIVFHENTPVSSEFLYNGQWQNDKQRGK